MNAEKYTKEFEKGVNKPVKRKKMIMYAVFIVILAALTIHYVPKFVYYMHHESTDNAFVKGDVIPVSSMVKGKVAKVYIDDNMAVKKGDKLFELDREEYEIALSQKQEELSAANAQIAKIDAAIDQGEKAIAQAQSLYAKSGTEDAFAVKEMNRYGKLASENLVSKNFYDSVKAKADETGAQKKASASAVEIAKANLLTLYADRKTAEFKAKSAEQAVKAAELDLTRTVIAAPADGIIGQNNVKAGRYVQAGQTVISLVDHEKLWIEANFKETQMEHIRIGQEVEIEADAFPHAKITGRIGSIQPGTGSAFSLLPAENATGNFVKVVQRVPVKIALVSISNDAALIPGLSVVPSVKIK